MSENTRLKNLTTYYQIQTEPHIKRVVKLFDKAYAGVLFTLKVDSVTQRTRRRPIPFLRNLMLMELDKMYPLFGEISYTNHKMLTQEMIATVFGMNRSTFPHGNNIFEQDKIYFKPLVDMLDPYRKELEVIAKDIQHLSEEFEYKKSNKR